MENEKEKRRLKTGPILTSTIFSSCKGRAGWSKVSLLLNISFKILIFQTFIGVFSIAAMVLTYLLMLNLLNKSSRTYLYFDYIILKSVVHVYNPN